MSGDREFELDHIYDLPPLSPSADHFELLQHQQREDQWRRTREPVAEGSKFLKFLTWRDLVKLNLVTESQVIGEDDPTIPDAEIDDPKVYAYARDFDPSTNDGASSPLVISFGSGKPDAKVIAFDPAANESAEIQLILPPEWPGKSLQCRIYWSHGLATSWGVVWEVQAHSAKDAENMAVDYVPGMVAVDEGGDTNHLYISASNVVTIETGNAMPGDLVFIKLIRRTDHEDDTLDGDAYFHAIEFMVGDSPADFPEPPPTGYEAALLLHFDGNFADSSVNNHTPTEYDSIARSSTAKFGSQSLLGNGAGRVQFPYSTAFDLGAQWAFDCYVYIPTGAALGSTNVILAKWSNSPDRYRWIFGINGSRQFTYYVGSGTALSASWSHTTAIPLDQWVHVMACIRHAAGNYYVDVAVAGDVENKVAASTDDQAISVPESAPVCVGNVEYGGAGLPTGVLIDEIRLINGPHEFDGTDFTPPAAPY